MDETMVVEKIMHSMTKNFHYVVCTIEEANNGSTIQNPTKTQSSVTSATSTGTIRMNVQVGKKMLTMLNAMRMKSCF